MRSNKRGNEMLQKYESYTYEIIPIEVEIATGRHEEYPQTKTGYEFTIFNVYADDEPHHSDEWHETESEAVIAAEHLIDNLMDHGTVND